MKKMIMLVLALSLTILAACNDDSASEGKSENNDKESEETAGAETETAQPQNEKVEITDEEKVSNDEVVTQINGEEIKGEEYNASYAQTKMLMSQYGQDVSDSKTVKDQTLNVIVEQELLKQDAKEQGIEVTDNEVQKEFETIKEENADQFAAVLEQFQLTEASYKEQLAFEITLQKYTEQEMKAGEVTNEEVEAYYEQLKEQSEEVPKLEEVKEEIKAQLSQQKQTQQLQAKVEQLKENAEIEHMI